MFRKIKCCFSEINKKKPARHVFILYFKIISNRCNEKKKNILPRELSFNYRILCAETLEKIYRTRGRLSRPTVPTHTRATFKESGKRRRTESSPPSPSPSPSQSLVPRLRTEDNKFIFNLSDSRLIYQRRPSVDRGAHLRWEEAARYRSARSPDRSFFCWQKPHCERHREKRPRWTPATRGTRIERLENWSDRMLEKGVKLRAPDTLVAPTFELWSQRSIIVN